MDEDTEVWQHVFQELIQEVKPWHTWTLAPDKDLSPNVLKQGWTQYQQKAFARFHCPTCCRSWASGRVLVVFHMHWCEKKGKGRVKMRAFAQRCSRCPEPPFAAPEFTWDNVSRILNNLIFRILKKCYKEEFKQMDNVPLLGDTSLEGPHDSNNCEACLQGFCAQSGLGPTSKPPAPLLSPTSKSTREAKVTATCSNMPSSQPSSKVERLQASEGNPKASHPTKDDPKVSHTSRPSTVPIVTTQPLSLVSSPTARNVTDTPYPTKSSRAAEVAKNHPRSKALPHSSSFAPPPSSSFAPPPSDSFAPPPSSSFAPPPSSSFAPPTSSYVLSSSNVKKPQVSAVNPKASHPTKDDPKVSHTSRSSTVPIVTTQPLLLVSSPTPKYVTDTPYPIKSSRAAEVAKKKPRSKALPPSSSFAPPPSSSFAPPPSSLAMPTSFSYAGHSSWSSPANTTCQVEISSHSHPQSESFCCKACCEGCCKCWGECCKEFCNCMSESPCCRRFVFLIFVAIVVILVIRYGL